MGIGLSTNLRTARMSLLANALNGGLIEFYSGTRPSTAAAITDQTLLATCMFSDPCGDVANGTLTFDEIQDDIASDDSGQVTWARAYDSGYGFVMDLGCGLTGSGAEIILNTVDVLAGGVFRVLGGTISEGNL